MKNRQFIPQTKNAPHPKPAALPVSATLMDKMVDGKEFESLLHHQYVGVNLIAEIRKSVAEITAIRKRPLLCYIANVVKPKVASVAIEGSDDLPFNEMVTSLPTDAKDVDIAIVTPGGFAHQVAKFVNTLRPKFDNVGFLVLNQAMSAGTIFVLSGDEVIMRSESHIGPIDPQVRTATGEFIPAQSILTLLDDIKKRGEENIKKGLPVSWVDLQLLKNMDGKEIGNAINASRYSIQLVEEYLNNFKFKNWMTHKDGRPVTPEERKQRANDIASNLCDHSKWKNHGHAITRDSAWDVCQLKITKSEDVAGLDRAMRRMWALFYWIFENTEIAKIFVSDNYCLIRNDPPKQIK